MSNASLLATSGGGAGTPGGLNTQVQFNDSGAFGGDADFIWDKTNNEARIGANSTKDAKLVLTSEAADIYDLYLDSTTNKFATSRGTFNQTYRSLTAAQVGTPITVYNGDYMDYSNPNAISSIDPGEFGEGEIWSNTGSYLNFQVSGRHSFTGSPPGSETNYARNTILTRTAIPNLTAEVFQLTNYGDLVQCTTSGMTFNNASGQYTVINYGHAVSVSATHTLTAGTLTTLNFGQSISVSASTAGTSTNYGLYIDFVTGADTNYAIYSNSTAASVLAGDLSVPDEAYGVAWNGSLEVPTKNAVYDKIQTIVGGSGISAAEAIAYAVSL
tara:strand:+ start:3423 stop:4406 length:984 start_codon:yes stop_codon:yes gene_type:complete